MKKLLPIGVLFALFIGCYQDDTSMRSSATLDEILGTNDYAVHQGILTFRNEEVFNKTVEASANWSLAEQLQWQTRVNFESLNSIYENAILAEDKFLEQMVARYGEDSNVGRSVFGYSEYVKQMLANKALRITDDEIIDVNATTRILSHFINKDRLVRVGNEIRQYSYDTYKRIGNAAYDQISNLNMTSESNNQIFVGNVEHQVTPVSVGKTQDLVGTCESVVDKYKLIAYEGITKTPKGGSPCEVWSNTYDVTLRSLRKILGTWQNYQTNFLSITYTYSMNHYNCDFSFNRYVNGYANTHSVTSPGTWHTFTWNLIFNYDTGPCTNSSPNCTTQPGYITFRPDTYHNVTAFGYNNTQCNTH